MLILHPALVAGICFFCSVFDAIIRFVASFTVYYAVRDALNAPAPYDIDRLILRMNKSREISLIMLCALFGFYIQADKMPESACTAGGILLTKNLSTLYDGMNSTTFKERIKAIGATPFAIINALPHLFVTFLLIHEILREDVKVGSILLFFAISPAMYQTICEWGKRMVPAPEDAQPQVEPQGDAHVV